MFTVTLTADELAHLAAAYRFMRHESEMPSALAALDAAKPARARATRPRATPAAAEPFSPNTGNPAVDEFMRRKHSPEWEKELRFALRRNVPGAIPMPAPAPGWPLKPKDARTFTAFFG